MRTKRLAFFVIVAAVLASASCSDGRKAKMAMDDEAEEEPMPERYESDDLPRGADGLFDDFIYYFASNEQLQRRRIDFPIEESLHGKATRVITEGEWRMDPLFMDAGEYTLVLNAPSDRELVKDTATNNVTVEKIFLTEDSVRQFLFTRANGRWMLRAIRMERLANHANASFLQFYQQFASDSAFQVSSLCDEIAFSGPDPDDDFAQMEGFITPDSWEAFAPELPCDSIFTIVYGKPSAASREKTIIVCGISNGEEMELTFRQRRGKWRLAKLTE